jgi:hypothetical protein
VSRILLVLTERRRNAVVKINWGIISSHQFEGRIFLDPGHDFLALVEELLEARELFRLVTIQPKCMAAINAIGCPFLHLFWVERGLRADDSGAAQPCRLTRHRIIAFRIGHVVVKGQPEAGTGTRRAA